MENLPPDLRLTPEYRSAAAEADREFRVIRREISFATFDAWSVAIFGGLTLVCSLGSISGMLVGLGMGAIAFVEFKGIRKLRRLELDAPMMLAKNQAVFAGILILYACYKMIFPESALSSEFQDALGSDPQFAALGKDVQSMGTMINVGMYVGVILFALVFQGGSALYHWRKAERLKRYVEGTPVWILELHSAGILR